MQQFVPRGRSRRASFSIAMPGPGLLLWLGLGLGLGIAAFVFMLKMRPLWPVGVGRSSMKDDAHSVSSYQFEQSLVVNKHDYKTIKGGSRDLISIQFKKNELSRKYSLDKARKQGAVEETVNYLISMHDMNLSEAIQGNARIDSNRLLGKCSTNSCPICNVTIDSIMNDGTFEFIGNQSAPYSDYCWSMRVRYHVAPACEKEERSRGVQPPWSWRWTLKAAMEGYCIMPSDSPTDVSALYAERQKLINLSYLDHFRANSTRVTSQLHKPKANTANSAAENGSAVKSSEGSDIPERNTSRPMIVVMLGLCFMGQPFMAMGCRWSDIVTGGAASGKDKSTEMTIPVDEIRASGGQCSGYNKENIADFYTPESHEDMALPKQNMEFCHMDHALIKYSGKHQQSTNSDGISSQQKASPNQQREMWVCYIYTFNIQKNIKNGQGLPCKLPSWEVVDVVLTIPKNTEIITYLRRTGAGDFSKPSLAHLKVVNIMRIYDALLYKQLEASDAYKMHGSSPLNKEDFQAKFKRCTANVTDLDIHYRMPGLPDIAASVWLNLIATGLGREEDRRFEKRIGRVGFWLDQ